MATKKATAAAGKAALSADQAATLRSAEDFLAGTPSQAAGKAPPGGQQLFGGLDADDAEAAAPARAAIDTRGISMRPVAASQAVQTVTILIMCLVLIVKDAMQQVPKQVYRHELPILRRIYGEDGVVEKSEEDYEVTGFDVNDEYDRLIRIYGGAPGAVEAIYGHNPRDLADELDIPYKAQRGAYRAREQEQSLVVDNSVEAEPGPTVRRTAELQANAAATGDAGAEATSTASDPTAAGANKQVGVRTDAKPAARKVTKTAAAKPAAKKTAARR